MLAGLQLVLMAPLVAAGMTPVAVARVLIENTGSPYVAAFHYINLFACFYKSSKDETMLPGINAQWKLKRN